MNQDDINLAIAAMQEELSQRYSQEDTILILMLMGAILQILLLKERMPLSSHLAVEALRSVATIIELKLQDFERENF